MLITQIKNEMLRPKLKIFLKTERSPQEIEELVLKLLRDSYEKLVNFIMFDSSSPPLLINFMIDYSMQKLSLVEQVHTKIIVNNPF